MIYKELGRTGLKVSRLGFGCMRFPMIGQGAEARVDREKTVELLHHAFKQGVNYVDTAVFYCNHDSQPAVGEALKGWRDKIVLSTKNHYFEQDESAWWKNLTDSLERMDVQYIDVYNMHGVGWKLWGDAIEPRVSKWLAKAKDQGLIKHICCSFHDNNEALVKIVDTGFVESITLQYNMLDRQLEGGIAHAAEKGVGIVVMGPVAGGQLSEQSRVLAGMAGGSGSAELAMRFVLSNPGVTLAISGMTSKQQIDENVKVACQEEMLRSQDREAISRQLGELKEMAKLYCSGCEYCMPCPQEVQIPRIFQRYNLGRAYGLWEAAKRMYAAIGTNEWDKGRRADACIDCGVCEGKCPQKLPIRKQLKEVHEKLKS